MLEIFVNNISQNVESPVHTWGDLLASLDDRAAGEGLLLTAARFDGVDEPSFRAPELTARRLTSVDRVDVEIGAPAALLCQCLLESFQPLEDAADMIGHLSALYRQSDVAPGHEGLRALSADLRGLTTLVGMISGPLQIDLSRVAIDGVTAHEEFAQLGATIESLVAAQESEDWLTVADILEYDLEPTIRRWIALLRQLRDGLL